MHTTSDSAVLGYWYDQEGAVTHDMLNSFDGIFAITLLDERTGHFVAARDPMGICPMYWGKGADGSTWFASEMKALHDVCETFDIFPPVRARSCPYSERGASLLRWYSEITGGASFRCACVCVLHSTSCS